MFLTADSATVKEALNWADHISSIIPSQSTFSTEYPFGKKGDDSWVHVDQTQWKKLMSETKSEDTKNVFSIAPIDTNHLVSVTLRDINDT